MKKAKVFFKNNIKLFIGIIIGITISCVTVFAATTLLSQSVYYNNTSSGMSATNVQDALDELYTKASKWLNPNDMGTPKYYATTGTYKGWCTSTDTTCNSYVNFPTTATTPPSGKNVYAVEYEDGQYGVCIQRNGKEHCFRGRNYKAEAKHVQEVFSDISCKVYSSRVNCYASDFACNVGSHGYVYCVDYGTNESCHVNTDGSVNCS